MVKKVIFLDLKKKVDFEDIKKELSIHLNDSEFVSFSPYSLYVLEKLNIKYKNFHFLQSTEIFRNNVLLHISELKKKLNGIYIGLMIEFIKLSTYLEYEKYLSKIYRSYKDYEIIYISDTQNTKFDFTNNTNIVHNFAKKKIFLQRITNNIPINNNRNINISNVICKIIFNLFKINCKYEWQNYISFIIKNRKFLIANYNIGKSKNICLLEDVKLYLKDSFFKIDFFEIITNFKKSLHKKENLVQNRLKFFTWVLNFDEYIIAKNNFSFFYQHGNYFYKNMIFKYSEIEPADVNFVFNDYTKKLFEDLGAKKVYSVGSILFNRSIKERKKEYDYLYITQGHDYLGNLQYVDFPNSLHSFDGYELYQRHKNIIKLFGEKFKNKKIIIRVHPTVVTNGVYVPFWELAEPYPNVTIDVSMPIHNLIEKSKYIISDYFTTEFINRELHYKRDIILFQGAPTPLPEGTIEDMKKMFILVDTIDDLEDKIQNIEEITKNRKRYDEIIEYYSSKKCDTKKLVTEILEKELNARR